MPERTGFRWVVQVATMCVAGALVSATAPSGEPRWAAGWNEFCRLMHLPGNARTRVAARPSARRAADGPGNIVVNYIGFNDVQRAAYQYAVDLAEAYVHNRVQLVVRAEMASLQPGLLGSGGARFGLPRVYSPLPGFAFYPEPLANHLANESTVTEYHIGTQFNSNINWYYGTDGRTPVGQTDYVSVVLHELTHGLGFSGGAKVRAADDSLCEGPPCTGKLIIDAGLYLIYDHFVETHDGHSLLNQTLFPENSVALSAKLTEGANPLARANGVYFNGPRAVHGNSGRTARLYTPTAFASGSSYSHLDEETYVAGNPNSLMTFGLASAEAIHTLGPVTMGMFTDMGWDTCAPTLGALTTNVQQSAGTGTLSLTVRSGCGWTARSDSSFLTLTSAASGTGSTTVTYSFTTNPTASTRTGTLTVADVTYTVSQVPNSPPVFSAHPQSSTILAGQSTTFSAVVGGDPTPAIRWQVSSDGGTTWGDLSEAPPSSGTQLATLTITAAPAGLHGYRYRAMATNTHATVPSNSAILTVNQAPIITTHPSSSAVTSGTSTQFAVVATGQPAPTYQWQLSTDGGATWTNREASGVYVNPTSATLTVNAHSLYHGHRLRCVVTNAHGTATSNVAVLSVRGLMTLTPSSLLFAATKATPQTATFSALTAPQVVTVSFAGVSSAWTASTDQSWIQITNGSGSGAGQFTVSIVNPGNVLGGSPTAEGAVTISSPTAPNTVAAVSIRLNMTFASTPTAAPIGVFDTPRHDSTVSGSLAVTGWALDDVGIDRVEIWRDLITNDPVPPFRENGHPADGKVFIANGTFVEGTRPDVELIYTTMPARNRAGWGYLLLTQGFPNSNGTFVLTAIAWDKENKSTVLGTKTIVVNNSASTKPFGSIDVPAYGATFSGHQFTYGWALTPNAGCTMSGGQRYMTIDSAPPNFPVTYGANRTDIAASFPGFQDSNGAGGAVALNSLNYTNGTHQIGWLVYDSCGNGEGIGSRFFTILNSGAGRAEARPLRMPDSGGTPALNEPRDLITGTGPAFGRTTLPDVPASGDSLWLVRGMGTVETSLASGSKVWLSQTGRVEVHATRPGVAPIDGVRYEGYLVVNGDLRALPLGSSFDATRGSFFWQPVAGFLGTYELRIVQMRGDAPESMWAVPVEVGPEADSALLHLDSTAPEGLVLSERSLRVEGWALDPLATDGSGIGQVHVWTGGTFLGAATLGQHRKDVGDRYGRQFDASGFSLALPDLPPGEHQLVVYAWSVRTGRWEAAKIITLSR